MRGSMGEDGNRKKISYRRVLHESNFPTRYGSRYEDRSIARAVPIRIHVVGEEQITDHGHQGNIEATTRMYGVGMTLYALDDSVEWSGTRTAIEANGRHWSLRIWQGPWDRHGPL